MSAVAIASIVVVGLLLAAVAAFLMWVVGILRSIHASLGDVGEHVRRTADRTAPITPALRDVNDDLQAVADALDELAATSATSATSTTTTPHAQAH